MYKYLCGNRELYLGLLKKNSPLKIVWTQELHEASPYIKNVFSETPVLKNQNVYWPFVLQTDANGVAIADCLSQSYNQTLQPVFIPTGS